VAARRHKTIYLCLVHRKICGRMMVFHVRRAVTSFLKSFVNEGLYFRSRYLAQMDNIEEMHSRFWLRNLRNNGTTVSLYKAAVMWTGMKWPRDMGTIKQLPNIRSDN
jgi:hypothetical protein